PAPSHPDAVRAEADGYPDRPARWRRDGPDHQRPGTRGPGGLTRRDGLLSAYAPIIALFALAAAFALFSLAVARLVGPRRYNRAKLEPYECGIEPTPRPDRKSTRLNSSHVKISYAVFCL